MQHLYFTERPTMVLATNLFVNVPIVLQYEETPLIQFVEEEAAGFTTEIPIYGPDGTYFAKAKGSQLFLTADGKKAGLSLEHPDHMTVCKMGDRIVFEMRRDQAAALQTQAELHTPDGYFLKCTDAPEPALIDTSGDALQIGSNIVVQGNRVSDRDIGIWVKRNGFELGVKNPKLPRG